VKSDAQQVAFRITVAAAVVVVLCTVCLIADYTVAAVQAPGDKDRIEELEAGVKSESGVAQELHDERERQTDARLAREKRSRIFAWGLLVSGGLFVAAGKRLTSLRPQPLPSLDRLVSVRFDTTTPPVGMRPSTSSVDPGDGEIDPTLVVRLVERHGRGREAAIPILQAIQTHYRYLPDEALRQVCELTEISPAQIAGTSSFYAQFRRSPVGRHVVRVCHGTACHVAAAEQITQELRRHLEIPDGEDTDPRRLFTIDAVACVGCCSLAPVMMIEQETAGRLTPATARQVLDALEPQS
jgi:NADH:ubiquinone oxidoreductase subunit E